jgi:hemoglobin
MREALKDVDVDDELKQDFWNYVEAFSKLTVNSFKDLSQNDNPYF